MSLISQNVLSGRRKQKHKAEEEGEEVHKSHPFELEEDAGAAGSSASATQKRKKRSRNRDAPPCEEKDAELEREEEERLEKALFGSLYCLPEFGGEGGDGDAREVLGGPSTPQFYIDKSGGMVVYEADLGTQSVGRRELVRGGRNPVWFDDEEDKLRVDVTKVNRLRKLREKADESVISGSDYVSRLRAQHVKLNPGTDWAQIGPRPHGYGSSDDESEDGSGITVAHGYEDAGGDDILRSNEELIVKGGGRLLPGVLEYSKLIDANIEDSSNAPINSVQFHRNTQLLLAAGLDRRLRFFQVDGKRNTKVESIFIEDCPIRKAAFLPDGSQVIIGGRRKFFYSFDLVKAKVDKVGPLTGRDEKSLEVFEVSPDSSTIAFIGNEGYILLVSSRTRELIGTLKMNGTARSLAFANDGQQLLSSGGDGHIYHWDLRTRKCFHKAVDEGCLTGSALCTSPDSALFAAGSSSGIVNIYKREEFLAGKRKPAKIIENLTTKVDSLKFNHDAQILAINSNMKKNSLKLVHLPSFTVYTNWPAARSNLQYPRCLDFSPNGGFMAVGNAAGKVLLYKLHHYQNA
uniref:U3 small nucleolar RNA-associated protein 18 homolog n=1 Tax=Anthurium amnicola TaxID=1678845 RepID=A0A1D1XH23_9ARAE